MIWVQLLISYHEKHIIFARNACIFPVCIDPGVPSNVTLSSISSSQFNLTWQKPMDPNGIILGYVVKWKMVLNDRGEKVEGNLKQKTSEANVTRFVLQDLGECVVSCVSRATIKRRVLFQLFEKHASVHPIMF